LPALDAHPAEEPAPTAPAGLRHPARAPLAATLPQPPRPNPHGPRDLGPGSGDPPGRGARRRQDRPHGARRRMAPALLRLRRRYSHSIVDGGFELMSSATRF